MDSSCQPQHQGGRYPWPARQARRSPLRPRPQALAHCARFGGLAVACKQHLRIAPRQIIGPCVPRVHRTRALRTCVRTSAQQLAHFFLGGPGRLLAGLLHPFVRGHWVCILMRIRALPRVGVMHPLRKQASVQRYFTAMHRCDVVEPLYEHWGQVLRSIDGVRGQLGNKVTQALGGRSWCCHLTFQVPHEVLALVPTAHSVQTRSRQAVGPRAQVVGQDDGRPQLIRFIQRTQSTEVLDLLVKLPVTVQALLVEVQQRHTARSRPFDGQKLTLQAAALAVVEGTKTLTQFVHHLDHVIKAKLPIIALTEVASLDFPHQ
mmetsp:Transcript_82415/g.191436  ORF Transcript_82415/g.191436 Transcript_82415/m.191436 type:complete len:318 (+) Transcript_82415:396-1349(+)